MKPWVSLSRRLTLDSKKTPRTMVIQKLKEIDSLHSKLKEGLVTPEHRSYALDVIAALKILRFIPILEAKVPEDPDGYGILTLNTLLDNSSYKRVGLKYKAYLNQQLSALSPGAIVALVDSLSRWGTPLERSLLSSLLGHEFPEVKLATIDYLRSMTLVFRKKEYLKEIPKLLELKPYQVRLKALYFFDELPGGRARLKFLKPCLADKNRIVRKKCLVFKNKWGGA